jgi:hypothetical protein
LPIHQPCDPPCATTRSDLRHLLEGLGPKALAKLFHNLQILAWAVVLAKVRRPRAPLSHGASRGGGSLLGVWPGGHLRRPPLTLVPALLRPPGTQGQTHSCTPMTRP